MVSVLLGFGCRGASADAETTSMAVYRKFEKNGYGPDSEFFTCTIQDGPLTKVVEGRAMVAALKDVRESVSHSDPTGLKVRLIRKGFLQMNATTISISPTGRGIVTFANGSRIYFSGLGFYEFCQDKFDS